MHITEGYLPLSHCLGWTAVSAPFAVAGIRAVSKSMGENPACRVQLAAAGAFLFCLTALRLPSLTGSSSHPTGTAVGTCLFGPLPVPALSLIVLLFQALLLAHGGLTTLGANLFSLGVAGPWVAWLIFRACCGVGIRRDAGVFLGSFVGDLATYATTAGQLAYAFPDPRGGFTASFLKFLGVFLATQVPIAFAEAFLSVAVVRTLSGYAKSNPHFVAAGTRASVGLGASE